MSRAAEGQLDPAVAEALIDSWAEDGKKVVPIRDSKDWNDPIPLISANVTAIDTELLPGVLANQVRNVAVSKQVPAELPTAFGLGTIATAVQGKAVIRLRPDYAEPLSFYSGIAMEPGERKSAGRREMTAPLEEYELEAREQAKPAFLHASDQRDILEDRLKAAKRQAAKARDSDGRAEAQARVRKTRDELEQLHVPALPTILTEDVTGERAAVLAAENYGRIAVLSAEGTLLEIMAGRYTDGRAVLDFYKNAWTGREPVRVERMSRQAVHITNPTATIVLAFQPSVLRTLQNKDAFRGQGIFGRFVWFMPRSLVGSRLTGLDIPQPDRTASAAYTAAIDRLLRLGPAAEDQASGTWTPHEIPVEPDALEAWSELEAEVELLLRDEGPLGGIRDFGAKLVGNTVRIAGLMHLVAVADQSDPFTIPLNAVQMERAAEIMRSVLIPHAKAAYGAMEVDPVHALAVYLWRRIDYCDITKRDLFDLSRGRADVQTVGDIEPALSLLERHDLVRIEQVNTGGRPSDLIRVNPNAVRRTPQDGDE
jgi:hypothetical protein